MIQRYGTQVSPNGDTLVYHEHGSWVKYTDHTAAIQELREALETIESRLWERSRAKGRNWSAMTAPEMELLADVARAALAKYKGEL